MLYLSSEIDLSYVLRSWPNPMILNLGIFQNTGMNFKAGTTHKLKPSPIQIQNLNNLRILSLTDIRILNMRRSCDLHLRRMVVTWPPFWAQLYKPDKLVTFQSQELSLKCNQKRLYCLTHCLDQHKHWSARLPWQHSPVHGHARLCKAIITWERG